MRLLSAPLRSLGVRSIWIVRSLGAGIAIVGVVTGGIVGGTVGVVIAACGVIWAVSAEAYVRKAALIRLQRTSWVAGVEVAGTVVFGVAAAAGVAWPADAVAWVGAAFVAKHVLEAVACRGWHSAFAEHGEGLEHALHVWLTQVLAYGCANVDFVVVGVMLSSAAFSVYSLAFRIAAVITSQVSYAAQRVMLVEFGEAADEHERQAVYESRLRGLFTTGLLAMSGTMLLAPLFPWVLGSDWDAIVGCTVVLAIGIPWRMTLGITGTMTLGAGMARRLTGWEVIRLVLTVIGLVIGASFGFRSFVVAATVVAVATAYLLHVFATTATSTRVPKWLGVASIAAVALAVLCGGLVTAI
jgi:O-antigen/teichoic acid export membrane protein